MSQLLSTIKEIKWTPLMTVVLLSLTFLVHNYRPVNTFDLQDLPLSPRQVQTKYGTLRGVIIPLRSPQSPSSTATSSLSPVEAFFGVPYAAPPTKTLRFMPPVTPSYWRQTKQATRFAPVCIQRVPDIRNATEALKTMSVSRYEYIKRLQPFIKDQSEDCLYLNIYVPHNPTSGSSSSTSSASSSSSSSSMKSLTKFPVIVFIGGESYEWANGNSFDASVFASFGQLIVITLNYRLGVFGFLPSILEGSVRGNYGLMDQVAALHWIQDNIVEFSGDSNNVTLIGHGYGSACAHLLMLSPMARGLFARVVLMSGSALSPWAIARNAENYSIKLAKELNCETYDNILMVECIRHKSVADIMGVDLQPPQYLTTFGPIIDGIVVPSEPRQIMETGISDFNYYFHHNFTPPNTIFNSNSVHYFNNYDLLFGVTRVESPYIFSAHEERHGIDSTKRDRILRTLVRNLFDFHQQSIFLTLMNEYTDWNRPVEHPVNLLDSTVDILGDALRVSSIVESGDLHSKWISSHTTTTQQHQSLPYSGSGTGTESRAAKIFFYVFAYQSEDGNKLLHQRLGCLHGEELAYLFGAPLAVQYLGRSIGHFPSNFSKSEVTLSEAVMTYWINFAKYGDPNFWPHEFDSHGDRTKGRFENVVWPQYDSTQKKYLMIGMKPKVRDHYHSHRLSFWLHLIPKLHKPGEEDIYLRHHLLYDHENPQSYDGIVRQIAFKFLEPLPTAPTLSKLNFNFNGNITNSSVNYSKLHTNPKPNGNQTLSTFLLSTPLSVSTEQTILSSINNNNNNNNKTTATAIVMNENSYTTALTVTIVIGCSLLFLNILIFAGIYYQLNSSKHKRKKKIKNFECSPTQEEGIVLSSTSGTLRTNSRSPPLSLSPMRNTIVTESLFADHSDSTDQCDGVVCNACPLPTATNTIQKGILKYNNKTSNHQSSAALVKCSQPQNCCVSCRYVNTRVPELRYDPIGVETSDISHEYCKS